jgi:hypothetical protein
VLLPEDGKASGVVTVTNSQGTQVLDQSWQSVEIAGKERPAEPVMLGERKVRREFGAVLAAMPAPPVNYLLYFKFDSTELLPESQLLLPEIVKVIKERYPALVSVVGHTDAVGAPEYNYRLGLERAAVVSSLLAAQEKGQQGQQGQHGQQGQQQGQGVVPAGIETLSRGKAELRVKTPDQVPEPRNRRAEVTVR